MTVTRVTTDGLADSAVNSAKIGVDVITDADLANNSVTVNEISNNAVTTAKIAASAVTEAKLGSAAVTEAKLGSAAVTTAKLHDDAVTHAKLPSGSVLQIVNAENTTGVALQSNASIKIMDCQIVTKMANSSFIVHAFCSIGTYNSLTGNTDTDVALALGYKSGAADASSGNYIGIGSYSPTRHFVSFSNGNRAFYSIDAFAGAHSYNYVYHAFAEPSTVQSFSPSVAAGTTLQVGLFGASDVNQTNLLFGTRRPDNGADSGTITYVCVTEISP